MFNLIHAHNNLWYGKFSIFPEEKIVHAISTRFQGYSQKPFNSLNLALHVQDNIPNVLNNRRIFCEGLNLDYTKMTTCQQVHGNKVICVTNELIGKGAIDFSDTIFDADALVTNLPQVPLTLFFADCTPILIYDPINHAIGTAHGGWRGTVGQIVLHTVKMMQKNYGTSPKDCLAAIGPSIGACCYEIGEEVASKFRELLPEYSEQILQFHQDKQKYHLDLWQANALMLQQVGLLKNNIEIAHTCTACNHDIFFSYRADNGSTGRIASIICLR